MKSKKFKFYVKATETIPGYIRITIPKNIVNLAKIKKDDMLECEVSLADFVKVNRYESKTK